MLYKAWLLDISTFSKKLQIVYDDESLQDHVIFCFCRAYFAVNLLNVVTELLDNSKHDALRILGCQTLARFIYSQVWENLPCFCSICRKCCICKDYYWVLLENRVSEYWHVLWTYGTEIRWEKIFSVLLSYMTEGSKFIWNRWVFDILTMQWTFSLHQWSAAVLLILFFLLILVFSLGPEPNPFFFVVDFLKPKNSFVFYGLNLTLENRQMALLPIA